MKDKYKFSKLAVGKSTRIPITQADPGIGRRALIAAYAYGRRNGVQFSGCTKTNKAGEPLMVITRVA